MQKIVMKNIDDTLTFEEGFGDYIKDCKARNLREATIKHYTDSYRTIKQYFNVKMQIKDITLNNVKDFVFLVKKNTNVNDQTLFTYSRDLKTILLYFMRNDWVKKFDIVLPKADRKPIECYTDEDISRLVKPPNIGRCTFADYRNWVIVSMFLATGIRAGSLRNIQVKDLDFDNEVVNITHTKNRKPLIVPLNRTIVKILKNYLKVRQYTKKDDYVFCTVYGKQMAHYSLETAVTKFNRSRGVEKTSIHLFRHTFAKKWILNGGNVVVLQKILGHSSLEQTQRYINLLVTDVKREMEGFNLLEEFQHKHIKMPKFKK